MKLAIVVQRYSADIDGGAELHARYVAEHLSRHVRTEVVTTCARDYVTWRNELAPGHESVNGVTVRRFPVRHERDVHEFARWSERVFNRTHSLSDELAWLDAEGPTSPALVRHLGAERDAFDYFMFFSYRYYHAYHGLRQVADRAVLVPTAERDQAIGLSLFQPIFGGVRALMYNSAEERAMIEAVAGRHDVPGVVVGVGSELPARSEPERFRRKFGVHGPYAVYVGRIDRNKGCPELFTFFQRYIRATRSRLTLVLIGTAILPVPDHPRIRHLGFLDDQDKFDAMAGAEALIMPSYYESLSMVALEAWGMGRPVLANGKCDVLKGQCLRSNAGLYYETFAEFAEALKAIESDRVLNRALGHLGRMFFQQHYAWPVVEGKYLDMFDRLQQDDLEKPRHGRIAPLPGWIARRRRVLPAAQAVVDRLPSGAVIPSSASPAQVAQ